MKIIKADNFDRDTVDDILVKSNLTKDEAKIVYETIKDDNKFSFTKPSSLRESLGSASKTIINTPISTKQPIIENSAFTRMQELAGIKPKN